MIRHPSSFSIKTHAADEEKIKRMELGNCIQTYMLNPMVKDTAERAAWLGNDETLSAHVGRERLARPQRPLATRRDGAAYRTPISQDEKGYAPRQEIREGRSTR